MSHSEVGTVPTFSWVMAGWYVLLGCPSEEEIATLILFPMGRLPWETWIRKPYGAALVQKPGMGPCSHCWAFLTINVNCRRDLSLATLLLSLGENEFQVLD